MRATRQTPPRRGSPLIRPAGRREDTVPRRDTVPRPRTSGGRDSVLAARDGRGRLVGAAWPEETAADVTATSADVPGRAFYRQPGIEVTTRWFVVAGRRFAITDLTDLRTARGPRDPLAVRAGGVVAVVLAVIAVVIGFTRGLDQVSALAYLALLVAAFIPVGIAWLADRLRPRSFELWGRHRGGMMLLFSSDEERQYGQVSRALMRAREVSRLSGPNDAMVTIEPWVPDRHRPADD
ncbi:DUF6232 family protein [Solwaraspora sp. WMMD406]|uniref:DUF6232 family protein n=1 Tax=Solwaraspora sp. WMMD406 TaxID=3016095 RepID=UPI002415CC73|nr:DUF6232 family protein [Solwaraspora sp. WMMD406]MDG4767377.1 DUF6232 family protein [Solwaraspora sp. WMMD406]